jgi:chromosome segregation ATPase
MKHYLQEDLAPQAPQSFLIARLDFHLSKLLKNAQELTQARTQLQQDSQIFQKEKSDFQVKVSEMSDLYNSLQRERQKLKEYRQKLYRDLPQAQLHFKTLKADFMHMLQTAASQKPTRSADMPLQMR